MNKAQKEVSEGYEEEHIPLSKRKIVKNIMKESDVTLQKGKEIVTKPNIVNTQVEPRPEVKKGQKSGQESNIKLPTIKTSRGKLVKKTNARMMKNTSNVQTEEQSDKPIDIEEAQVDIEGA